MPKPIFTRVGTTLLAMATSLAAASAMAETHDPLYLHQIGRISGLSIDPGDPENFLVATHFGVLSIASDGVAEYLAPDVGMLSELVRHPDRPALLLASGYRGNEVKLGIVRSDDGGRAWLHLADGADGPVAFHAMALGLEDANIIYGIDENLQVSKDGGLSWSIIGEAPDQVFDMAVSSKSDRTLFVAAMEGLLRSDDGGRTWKSAHPMRQPATMVHVDGNGAVHAFLYGTGLMVSPDGEEPRWETLSTNFGNRALMDMATDSARPEAMLAVADTGAVMISGDGGRRWGSFEGHAQATPARITAGRGLYEEICQACHGVGGIGENPADPMAVDQEGLPLAPALDDSAHAWHHSDADLVGAILDGVPRNSRMMAWREQGLSSDDAENLVAYIKSLWSFPSLACQGARHMSCMH